MNITILDAATLGDDLDVGVLRASEGDALTVWQSTTPAELAEHAAGAEVLILNKSCA